jgi:hypothetical protein
MKYAINDCSIVYMKLPVIVLDVQMLLDVNYYLFYFCLHDFNCQCSL